jgi:type II secretory pathway component GspD/PulD (secretin)
LDALENEGITNLISKPQIATLNGHSATITIGTTQYYYLQKSTVVPGSNSNVVETSQNEQKVDINMTLSVTPWVTSNDEVTMDIAPSFDVPGASSNSSLPPVVNRRSLNSKVRVKSGEMIILGGLIKAEVDKTTDKVPFLGSIPILGWFFSTKSTEIKKTQLMIYLVPHVYYGSERSIDPTTVDFKSDKPPMTKQEVAAQKKPWWHFW